MKEIDNYNFPNLNLAICEIWFIFGTL